MTASAEVVCAGILVADTFCGPVHQLPAPGALLQVDPFTIRTGGCAANTAICLAKQGVPSRVAGKVGKDAAGTGILDDLAGRGIDVAGVARSDTSPTSQTVILLCRNEDRRFLHNFGANAELSADEIEQALDPLPRIVYIGGYLAMPGLQAEALARLLARLQREGVTTVLDVVVPSDLRDASQLWQVLPGVDVFLPNEDEARQCTGLDDPLDQARALRDHGAKTVVLTMGGDGALAVGPDGQWRVGTLAVDCVDPSGGGDAFAAGLIKGLLADWPITRCVQLGAVLGASCVQAVGCHDGVGDEAAALRALAETPPAVETV